MISFYHLLMKSRLTTSNLSSLRQNTIIGNGVKVKVYLEGNMIGPGKMELLQLVAKTGSIRSASKVMGMSMKRANLLLKTIEDTFQTPILEKKMGNKGTKVSSFGKDLLEKYFNLCNHLSNESKEFISWASTKKVKSKQ